MSDVNLLRGLHMQVLGMQASLAAVEHSLRVALQLLEESGSPTEAPPSALSDAAEEIRRAVGGPTMEERRENVFMHRKQVDAATVMPDAHAGASGTPNGDSPVPSAQR